MVGASARSRRLLGAGALGRGGDTMVRPASGLVSGSGGKRCFRGMVGPGGRGVALAPRTRARQRVKLAHRARGGEPCSRARLARPLSFALCHGLGGLTPPAARARAGGGSGGAGTACPRLGHPRAAGPSGRSRVCANTVWSVRSAPARARVPTRTPSLCRSDREQAQRLARPALPRRPRASLPRSPCPENEDRRRGASHSSRLHATQARPLLGRVVRMLL